MICGASRWRSARPRSPPSWPRLRLAYGSTSISRLTDRPYSPTLVGWALRASCPSARRRATAPAAHPNVSAHLLAGPGERERPQRSDGLQSKIVVLSQMIRITHFVEFVYYRRLQNMTAPTAQ